MRNLLVCLCLAGLLAVTLTAVAGNKYRPTLLLLKVHSLEEGRLQVYFKAGKNYVERLSDIKSVRGGSVTQSLYFTVPDKRITSIRVDPDNDIHIIEMALVDRQVALVTELDLADLTAHHDIDTIKAADDGVEVITSGSDPQLSLRFFSRLPNSYGFSIPLSLTLTCIFYCLFYGILRFSLIVSQRLQKITAHSFTHLLFSPFASCLGLACDWWRIVVILYRA